MRMRGGGRFLGCLAAWVALAALAPALASAGSISGTVTAEGGGAPIQGVEVCAIPEPEASATVCDETGAAGDYQLFELLGAYYRIRFSGQANNLKYVSEWYDGATYFTDIDVFHLGIGGDATVNAALAEGGSISGRLTDEATHQPIAGVWACAIDSKGWEHRCTLSDVNGNYLLNGLPSGAYGVEYEGGNRVNYLHEFYEDAETRGEATDVPVTVPAVTSDVNAELARGGEILGNVTDPVTGAPSRGVFVCAEEQPPGEYQGCDSTDEAGNYAIRSLPAGAYLVAFNLEYYPWGRGAEEWWQGVDSAAEATPIVIAPPATHTGVNGRATSPYWSPPPPAGNGLTSQPPPAVRPKPKPRKCRKGFHRKLVKGKKRCVRKHKPRKHRQRQKGR